MSDATQLLEVLNLEMTEPGRFRAQNFAEGPGNVVFGGQLLAQTIVAASTVDPDKVLKSVHTVFAHGADPSSRWTSRSRPCTWAAPWPAPR